jgi:DnaJ-class molecular chaperone
MEWEFESNETEGGKKKECSTCFGNGFIYLGGTHSPCPECWGSGEKEAEEDNDEY